MSDTFTWLAEREKLVEEWNGYRAVSRLTKESFVEMESEFFGFDTRVRLKLVTAIGMMRRPLKTVFKDPVSRVLDMACTDNNEWISKLGGVIAKDLLPSCPSGTVAETLAWNMSQALARGGRTPHSLVSPMESPYLYEAQQSPQAGYHFVVKEQVSNAPSVNDLITSATQFVKPLPEISRSVAQPTRPAVALPSGRGVTGSLGNYGGRDVQKPRPRLQMLDNEEAKGLMEVQESLKRKRDGPDEGPALKRKKDDDAKTAAKAKSKEEQLQKKEAKKKAKEDAKLLKEREKEEKRQAFEAAVNPTKSTAMDLAEPSGQLPEPIFLVFQAPWFPSYLYRRLCNKQSTGQPSSEQPIC